MSFRHQPSDVLIHATDLRHLLRTPRTFIRSLLITRPVGNNFDEQRLRTAFRTGRTRTSVHLSLWGVEAAWLRHQIRERNRELSNFSWMRNSTQNNPTKPTTYQSQSGP